VQTAAVRFALRVGPMGTASAGNWADDQARRLRLGGCTSRRPGQARDCPWPPLSAANPRIRSTIPTQGLLEVPDVDDAGCALTGTVSGGGSRSAVTSASS
jgi:hypothetical protein